ncbi:MAG: GcrA family cell cycle regulator [Rhodocyclaceae bacterium]|jgi:GcrA cell cycle regulator
MVWTDEKVKLLVQLWETGQSITQIGKALGMTRNAVVGKAHRIGLAKRASPIMRSEKPAQPRQTASHAGPPGGHAPATPRAPAQPKAERAAASDSSEGGPAAGSSSGPGQQLTAAMLAALTPSSGPRCKWPIGDPKSAEFDFCSQVALPGKPYCAQHCAMAYTNWNPESAVEAVKAVNAA